MKNYLAVMKLLVKNMFKKNPNEQKGLKIFTYVTLGIVYAAVIVGLCASIVFISPAIVEYEMQAEVLTLIFSVSVLIILFLGITSVLTTLYFSRDTEFFMSLPISASTVYFAKISVIYVGMLALEAAILLPCLLTMGITMAMSPVFYIVGLAAVLTLPALPLMLASVLAMPLMYIVSSFKNKGTMTSVVTVLLFALVMGAYMFVAMSINGGGSGDVTDLTQLLISAKASLGKLADILLPISAAARLATLTPVYGLDASLSALVNLAIFIGFTVALFAVAFGISSFAYKKAAVRMTEGSRKSKSDKKHDFKSSGTSLKALVGKEWRQLIRTPAFAMNALMVIIFTPLITVIMNVSANFQMQGEDPDLFKAIYGTINVAFLIIIGVGLNYGSCTCITREGESFGFSKSLPVDSYTHIKAKRILYLIIGYVSSALGIIVSLATVHDYMVMLLAAALLVPYNIAYVNLAIYHDLNAPRLKWTTPKEAVKRDVKGMLPFFINMGIGMVFMIFILSTRIMTVADATLAPVATVIYYVVWGVAVAAAIITAAVSSATLKNNAHRLYDRIEI